MITIPDTMRRPAEIERDELRKQLAEAQTEVERLALEIENQQYTITCASEENQQLKESLAEARAEIERLKGVVISQITPEPVALSSYSTTAEPAKDERDKLIEQMKKLLKAVECSEFEGPICFDIDGKNWYDAREAALSAAERGGK